VEGIADILDCDLGSRWEDRLQVVYHGVAKGDVILLDVSRQVQETKMKTPHLDLPELATC
jgi:hypothetical protein